MRAAVVLVALAISAPARADEPMPLVDVRVEGATKITEATATRLARVELGDRVDPTMVPRLQSALLSS
ncbi:MAG TPA: hypothetical protein VFS15_10835, partial [Kofleriaceae bacterium]|nr:hypothetical protein [Kofleriaceae bacterium]